MIRTKKPPRPVTRPRLTLKAVLKLVSKTADGMFAIDSNGEILAWNPSASKILGYRAKEVIGKPCYEILSARDPSGNLFCFEGCAVMTMAKEDQLIRNYNTQVITKNNRKIWLNTSILLLPGEERSRPLIVHLFRPITPPDTKGGRAKGVTFTPKDRTPFSLSPSREAVQPSLNRLSLTSRESEVLALLGRCLVAKEIASKLQISTETARTHIQRILKKLHVHSKLEAVIVATQQGLL
ncbi:MAG: LuxR C-terminal-related transcriptional regulator [Nitrospiria bacterium]